MSEEGRTIPGHHGQTAENGPTQAGQQCKQAEGCRHPTGEQTFSEVKILAGQYIVLEDPNRGGMGDVYKCYDRIGGGNVALKMLRPDIVHSQAEMKAVRRNYQLVASLRHANIALYKTLVCDRDTGGCYLIMEYVDGLPMHEWMALHQRENGSIPLKTILPVLRQTAEALDYAHGMGVVHCDVKPSNLIIDNQGTVKLIDFGLASQSQRVNSVPMVNGGTLSYMSPEQWREEPVQGTADQYALGVLAYRMLAGQLPFEASDRQTLRRLVLETTAEPVPNQPASVQTALAKVLSKDPEQRFSSCLEFVQALEQAAKQPSEYGSSSSGAAEVPAAEKEAEQPQAAAPPEPPDAAEDSREKHSVPLQSLSKESLPRDEVPPADEASLGNRKKITTDNWKKIGITGMALAVIALGCWWCFLASRETQLESLTNGWEIGTPVQFSVKGVTFDMMPCPAGTFMMGSPDGELGRWTDEKQHEVTLSKPFLLGKYEVTQELYEAVMGKNPSENEGKQNPVENVSWDEADAFCRRLNELLGSQLPTGYQFDLPTEAQWEHACRAGGRGSLGRTRDGDRDVSSETDSCPYLDNVAWYDENSGSGHHAVGGKDPNVWGLYDMHGNVWEWCRDWYEEGYASDPEFLRGQKTGSYRVTRGGSWGNGARDCRAANRGYFSPSFRLSSLGIRLALVLVP